MSAAPVIVAALVGGVLLLLAVSALRRDEAPVTRSPLREVVRALLRDMPRGGSGDYRAPTDGQASGAGRAYALLLTGDRSGAAATALGVGMEVATVEDPGSGQQFDVVREPPGRAPRGWGLFVHRPGSASKVVVEAVHPLADRATVRGATALFERVRARDLLIAGAHRGAGADASADVAHAKRSVLQEVHEATLSSGVVIVQLHGFDAGDDRGQRFGDAVVSSGTWRPSRLARHAAEALEDADVTTCLVDRERCADYAARRNIQGRAARAAGVAFLHVELSPEARRSRRLPAVLTALASVLPLPGAPWRARMFGQRAQP
ncbi:MAG: hypothetical protein M3Q27_05075 [Actinomycetota bacterium]|nr:hypothetical protein [Actinomycetota bacterium]